MGAKKNLVATQAKERGLNRVLPWVCSNQKQALY